VRCEGIEGFGLNGGELAAWEIPDSRRWLRAYMYWYLFNSD
jgi:hypothetical protein